MDSAQPRLLGNMTWTEAREAAAGNPVTLLPVGMVEQHGPHLPLAADSLVADWVAQRVSEQTGALVAPIINYGHSPFLRGYAGTLSLRSETLRLVVADIIAELVGHGFRRIIVVNNHAGNEGAITEAALDARHKFGVLVGSVYPWAVGYELMRDQYENPEAAFGHGAEPERSALLAMFPELVRPATPVSTELTGFDGWQPAGYTRAAVPGQSSAGTVYWDLSEISESGVVGDATAASLDNGRIWVERVVAFACAFVTEYDANTREAEWARPLR